MKIGLCMKPKLCIKPLCITSFYVFLIQTHSLGLRYSISSASLLPAAG